MPHIRAQGSRRARVLGCDARVGVDAKGKKRISSGPTCWEMVSVVTTIPSGRCSHCPFGSHSSLLLDMITDARREAPCRFGIWWRLLALALARPCHHNRRSSVAWPWRHPSSTSTLSPIASPPWVPLLPCLSSHWVAGIFPFTASPPLDGDRKGNENEVH